MKESELPPSRYQAWRHHEAHGCIVGYAKDDATLLGRTCSVAHNVVVLSIYVCGTCAVHVVSSYDFVAAIY